MKKQRVAIYPGTFDPVTNGHIDIMLRAAKLFDALIVAVAHNPKKNPLFSLPDRVGFIRETVGHLKNIEILPFDNLLIDFAATKKATVIIKGLRAVSDFEYELQMGLMNRNLNDAVETVFMIPSQEFSFLSSSFVKEIARHGGDIAKLVPKSVLKGIHKLNLNP
jgi:pantetheine-phosphate adenylyltransferase